MSDDAETPGVAEAAEVLGASEVSGASLEKGPKVSLGKGGDGASGSLGEPGVPGPGGAVSGPERDPWAPPVGGARVDSPGPVGAGHTFAPYEPPTWPAPSVHDQETVGSAPTAGVPSEPRDAVPPAPPWMNPSAGGGPSAGAAPAMPVDGSAVNPFAPPGGSAANPFAPPGAASPTAPMASASLGAPVNPFAPPVGPGHYAAHGEHVPPPPIGPEGPGRVPYGYPGGHGFPPGPGAAGYYGWPGMHALPSNGMGTAGLVLGIISAVVFCLWPVAIVVGVLAVIVLKRRTG